MYRKILVPLDDSPTAVRGLDEALALAKTTGASLVLLHVIDAFPFVVETATSATWEALMDGLRQQGRALLQRGMDRARECGLAASERLVEFPQGRVADAILDEVKRAGCDLIVMGTHGRRGFRHALLGSDAERVLRQSPRPVLTVRHPDAARG